MLQEIRNQKENSLYKIADEKSTNVERFILSTPESRAICNDPLVLGIEYTRNLRKSCSKFFKIIKEEHVFELEEKQTVVYNILRGGLNFDLREALADAYSWNLHNSAFISAQRSRVSEDSEEWHILESDYKKVYFPNDADIVIGDVVATGTSLKHGMEIMIKEAQKQNKTLRSLTFFTYGGPITDDVLEETDQKLRKAFPNYQKTMLCYLEGRFEIPTPESVFQIKITGTDLVRKDSLMAPEFIESQYEAPSFPLERCTIYDAGSRAFHVQEYLEDVLEYWSEVLKLSDKDTFETYLEERFPELDQTRFGNQNLKSICEEQIKKLQKLL
ncbi:type I phosphoribosyltransferase [Sediminitomix flava]|uniref:Uncharacterized protein n=1 Tax=Sediminitomix flava TaxID=379075 RepID=A0A315Z8G5_SEDFL|nr:hypothetical protein [Sediminitomix flava]PWJ39990.1 hypothetical protein BC781_10553 [Sediminitomix flava]